MGSRWRGCGSSRVARTRTAASSPRPTTPAGSRSATYRQAWSRLGFHYGKLMAQGKYLALRDADPLTIKLRPVPDAAEFQARSDAANAARGRPQAPRTRNPRAGMGFGSLVRRPRPARSRITEAKSSSSTSGASGAALASSELPSLEKLAPGTNRSASSSSRSTLPARTRSPSARSWR